MLHFLYCISMISNIVVMVVYWSVLHEEQLEKFKGQSGKIFHLYVVHLFPGISCFLNTLSSNIVLKRGLVKMVMAVGIVQATV